MALARLLPLRFLGQSGSKRWPWVVCAAAWLLTASGIGLLLFTYSVPFSPRWGLRGLMAVPAVLLSAMGAVVASRRPRNLIGRVYCAFGLLCGVQFFGQEYAVFAVIGQPGRLPAAEWMAWLQNWIWVPPLALYLIYVPLLLPEGRLPSPRWRLVAGFGAIATALLSFIFAAQPGRLFNFDTVANPLGARQSPEAWLQLQGVAFGLIDATVLTAAISLVWRARHAGAHERQQLKWLAFAAAIGGTGLALTGLVPALAVPVLIATVGGMHAATGLAILRYRLYDLDVILNRTVVYGLLTAALAAIYFGCVVLLQSLAVTFTGHERSELVTVLSTLAIASLFYPLRRGIQNVIDRRFFRRKYDAAQALARFSQAIREDTSGDLDRLNESLIRAVDETLEPEFVSLWVRPSSSKESQ